MHHDLMSPPEPRYRPDQTSPAPFTLVVDGTPVDRFPSIEDALDHLPTGAQPWQIDDANGTALVCGEGPDVLGRVIYAGSVVTR